MSFQERNVVAAILVGLGFFVIYTMWVPMELRSGGFAGPDGVAELAKRTLWIIGGSIVASIVATIFGEIINAIITKTANTNQIIDERDRLIEKTGDHVWVLLWQHVRCGHPIDPAQTRLLTWRRHKFQIISGACALMRMK